MFRSRRPAATSPGGVVALVRKSGRFENWKPRSGLGKAASVPA